MNNCNSYGNEGYFFRGYSHKSGLRDEKMIFEENLYIIENFCFVFIQLKSFGKTNSDSERHLTRKMLGRAIR